MEMLPEPAIPVHAGRTYGGNRAFHNFANDYSHISDPNLRRRLALSEIDKVPFGLYHVRAVAVAGVGFFLDSYDIFAISMVTNFWGLVFWGGGDGAESSSTTSATAAAIAATYGYGNNAGSLPDPVNQALKASTSAGIIIGQLMFGWLADNIGRRRMYGVELVIIILSTLSCALASPSPAISSTGILVFWRVVMGIGIGGDYPLSSVITSEFAPTRWRGAMMASVFSMQGMGQLVSAIVALCATAAFRSEFVGITNASQCGATCRTAADRCWRIIIGFGALPACFALYYRVTIPETPRYTFDVAHDVEKADADIRAYMACQPHGEVDPVVQARLKKVASPVMASGPSASVPPASWSDMKRYFWGRGNARNIRILFGTMFSWFFLDLAYYGLALNNSVVLEAIGYAKGANLYTVLYNNAVGTIILACAGSLPGYWTAVLTIDTFGRKPLQVFGFLILTIIFCILGFAFHMLSEAAMLALYVVAQFFFNWGPNTTTFIVPAECFPTRYRSTAHGMSAAMGKLGAILAQVISIPILSKDAPANCTTSSKACSPWLNRLMQIFALFMLCGTIVSIFCIPETKGITLEELAGEAATSYNAGRNGSIGGGRSRRAYGKSSNDHLPSGSGSGSGSGMSSALKVSLKWNPFAGGQPAGFIYPRMGGGSGRRQRKRKIFGRPLQTNRNNGTREDKDSRDPRDPRGPRDDDDDATQIGIMSSPELAAQREANQNSRGGIGASVAGSIRGSRRNNNSARTSSNRPLLSRNGPQSNAADTLAFAANSVAASSRNRDSAASTATTTATVSNNNNNTDGRRPNWASNIHPLHPAFRSQSRDLDEADEADPYASFGGGELRHPPRTATAMSGMSGMSAGGTGRMDDDEILSTAAAGLGAGMFPGWGAGWGRVDREHVVGTSNPDDIGLRDVGQLLK